MLPRRTRLPRAAFPGVLSAGRRISSPHFSAVFSKEVNGYAVIVPKKVARLSVTRHRIKRRVFEALRALTLPAHGLILFPKASIADVAHKDVSEELAQLLSKIR